MKQILLLTLLLPPLCAQTRTNFQFNHKLQPFSTTDNSGKKWSDTDLKGKITYVYIWATWCAPCQEELPELEKLHNQLKTAGTGQVLAISVDEKPDEVKAYLQGKAFTFPIVIDRKLSDKNFPAGKIPAAFLVNRQALRTGRYVPPLAGALPWILEDIANAAAEK